MYYKVAVNAPINDKLTYLPIDDTDLIGKRVLVPLGKRKVDAVVLESTDDGGEFKLKSIQQVYDHPSLPKPYLQWLSWVADYYCYPIGQVVNLCYPPLEKAKNKRQVTRKKNSVIPDVEVSQPMQLTDEQQTCFDNISKGLGRFSGHLLKGVTGSGKTEVYLQLLDKVLQSGKRGLVLVPEISLTPQLLNRFSARFPGQVAIIHSHLTNREKTNQWWEILDENKKILIGARSALFCPMEDMGIIIVDEEHEPSFKQDEKLKYHARDCAVMLASKLNCPIVLGSATPSIETWKNAIDGKYQLHEMNNRVSQRQLPDIHIVDMRKERKKRQEEEEKTELPFWLSETLFNLMVETYQNNQQSALFLNRRGIAQSSVCQSCGFVHECPNCAINLTLHGKTQLVCHYCNYTERLKEECPKCHSDDIVTLGIGTELIENDLKRLFPKAVIDRADRDVIDSRDSLEQLIHNMEEGHTNILIGTQMIAKGLDFPKLQTVGLVMADVGFNIPDFRTCERSYQLITQVSGRAGRHSEKPGQVVIQTYNPHHNSIVYTKNNDFTGFADTELDARKDFAYPPFGRISSIRIQGNDKEKVEQASKLLARRAQLLKASNSNYETLRILGPTPSALQKLRGKYRFQILLKSSDKSKLLPFCKQLSADMSWLPTGTKVQIDMDPINML